MRWLDGILLGAAQWFCDKVQVLIGLTKFRLEKWALIMSMIFLWAYQAVKGFDSLGVSAGLIFTGSVVFDVHRIEKEEIDFFENGDLEYSPWHSVYVRIAVILVITLALIIKPPKFDDVVLQQFWLYAALFYAIRGYFAACIPKPPCKSKVRQWCEKAIQWFRDMREPAPVPEPSS